MTTTNPVADALAQEPQSKRPLGSLKYNGRTIDEILDDNAKLSAELVDLKARQVQAAPPAADRQAEIDREDRILEAKRKLCVLEMAIEGITRMAEQGNQLDERFPDGVSWLAREVYDLVDEVDEIGKDGAR